MYSGCLGREMELRSYGHAGKPVVVFGLNRLWGVALS